MDYLKVFEQIERAYRNQPDMKQEFAYDELTCIKKYMSFFWNRNPTKPKQPKGKFP